MNLINELLGGGLFEECKHFCTHKLKAHICAQKSFAKGVYLGQRIWVPTMRKWMLTELPWLADNHIPIEK